MDVHPPHRAIESKRDFFLHLFTITCGLLIALGLEGLVEMAHHHSLVVEARQNIRRELEDNQKATEKDLRSVQEDEARFRKNLDTERALHDKEEFWSLAQATAPPRTAKKAKWNQYSNLRISGILPRLLLHMYRPTKLGTRPPRLPNRNEIDWCSLTKCGKPRHLEACAGTYGFSDNVAESQTVLFLSSLAVKIE